MGDKTLGELVAGIARYRAQLIPLVVVLTVALFLDGARDRTPVAAPDQTGRAAAIAGGPQIGSVSVPPALAGPAIDVGPGQPGFDLSPSGTTTSPSAGGDGAPPDNSSGAGPLTPITCENDASLPQPVFGPAMEQLRALQLQLETVIGPLPDNIAAYVAGAIGCSPGLDPLSLVVNQLGPVLGAAGPLVDVLATVNPLLPALPVPPQLPLPALPPEVNPVLSATAPATQAVCGQLVLAFVLVAALSSFPLPVTGQHFNAALSPVFGACAILTP